MKEVAGSEHRPGSSRDDEQHRLDTYTTAVDRLSREPGREPDHAMPTTPEPGPLQELEANRRLVELLLAQRWSVIEAAREDGASWEAIGAALGISRQGAHDWYTRRTSGQDRAGAEIKRPAPRRIEDPSRQNERVTHRVTSRQVVHRGDSTHPMSEPHTRTNPGPEQREWSSAPFVDGGKAS